MQGKIAQRLGDAEQRGTESCTSQTAWKSSGAHMDKLSEAVNDE